MQLEVEQDQEKENLKEEVSSLKEAIARIVRSVEFTQHRSDWIDALKAGKDLIDSDDLLIQPNMKWININPLIWNAINEGRCDFIILSGDNVYKTGEVIGLRKGYANTSGFPHGEDKKPYEITCRLGLAMPECQRGANTGFTVFALERYKDT